MFCSEALKYFESLILSIFDIEMTKGLCNLLKFAQEKYNVEIDDENLPKV